jgi:hypothetical protein
MVSPTRKVVKARIIVGVRRAMGPRDHPDIDDWMAEYHHGPGQSVRRTQMPKFMDVHHGMHGITPEALQAAHQADLDIQGEEDVDFQRAWGDPESGMVWCVSEAPNADAVRRIHERTGHPATEVYPVPVEV